jgi:hypothetical protein
MTDRQKRALRTFLEHAKRKYEQIEFHHGDCIGADADAHEIAADVLGVDAVWIHPSRYHTKRAFKKSPHVLPDDDALDRNVTIVRITDGLIAAPKERDEVMRSGTWMTIREARDRQKKPLTILEP